MTPQRTKQERHLDAQETGLRLAAFLDDPMIAGWMDRREADLIDMILSGASSLTASDADARAEVRVIRELRERAKRAKADGERATKELSSA